MTVRSEENEEEEDLRSTVVLGPRRGEAYAAGPAGKARSTNDSPGIT